MKAKKIPLVSKKETKEIGTFAEESSRRENKTGISPTEPNTIIQDINHDQQTFDPNIEKIEYGSVALPQPLALDSHVTDRSPHVAEKDKEFKITVNTEKRPKEQAPMSSD